MREERKVFQVVEKELGASSKEFRIRETIFIEKKEERKVPRSLRERSVTDSVNRVQPACLGEWKMCKKKE